MEARQITVRNVPAEIARRLKELSSIRGESINATVLRILALALGVDERRDRLARYATWTKRDRREFEKALRAQRTIDESLWK